MGVLVASVAFAQQERPTGSIAKVMEGDVTPVVDGVIGEGEYATANVYNCDRNFQAEVPTVGDPGDTNWRMVWDDNGMYLFVTVTDDEYLPSYVNGSGNSYEYDKLEVYFDTNYLLQDGVGGGSGQGHYQVAPDLAANKEAGEVNTGDDGVVHAFMVERPNYTGEYFIPWSKMKDKDGIAFDKTGEMGFDVTVIDRDAGDAARKRAVWANEGLGVGGNESWSNMDECGILTFENADPPILVESVTITNETLTITENNGTLQMVATVLPEDATEKNIIWSVENLTGRAMITPSGLLMASVDGDVKVIAKAADASYEEAETVVTISNQIVSAKELSIIPNGRFNLVNDNGTGVNWGGWWETGTAHQVVDGVSVHTPVAQSDVWKYQFNNTSFVTEPNVDYAFNFIAWSEVDGRQFMVDFEDTSGNNYNRYGASSDATSNGGRSEWNFTITAEPVKYELNVNFDQKVPTTVDKVTFMLGLAEGVTYIDNVELIKKSDMDLVTEYVPVETIEVVAADMQMSANILPETADYKSVKWSILPGTGTASIDANGMVSGITAGNVTVVASAVDDSEVIGTLLVDVASGISKNKINSLKVYPSIANSIINIDAATPNAVATIYNSVGRKVGQVVTGKNIDVSYLAKGVYFVKVNNTVTKFIKQ